MSPITWTGHHLTLPSTAAAQEIPLRFPSPVSHPGITSKQASQAATTYTTWATSRHNPPARGNNNTSSRIPASQLVAHQEQQHLCLSSCFRTRNFRNVKANGRGASRAASVCVSYLQDRAFALCTLHLPLHHPSLRPIQRGSEYRPAAESTRAPVSQSADHSTSTHPSTIARSGSGTGLTEHRSSSTSVPFQGAESLGGDRRIKIGYTNEPCSVSGLLILLS